VVLDTSWALLKRTFFILITLSDKLVDIDCHPPLWFVT